MEIQTDNPHKGYPFPCYAFDINKSIVLNTAYIMSSESVDIRYVQGILNSKLGKFLVKLYVTQLQERQFRMLAQYVEKFPIVKPYGHSESKIVNLVNIILDNNSNEIEEQIDAYVYHSYNLTEEEINYLNNL